MFRPGSKGPMVVSICPWTWWCQDEVSPMPASVMCVSYNIVWILRETPADEATAGHRDMREQNQRQKAGWGAAWSCQLHCGGQGGKGWKPEWSPGRWRERIYSVWTKGMVWLKGKLEKKILLLLLFFLIKRWTENCWWPSTEDFLWGGLVWKKPGKWAVRSIGIALPRQAWLFF